MDIKINVLHVVGMYNYAIYSSLLHLAVATVIVLLMVQYIRLSLKTVGFQACSCGHSSSFEYSGQDS